MPPREMVQEYYKITRLSNCKEDVQKFFKGSRILQNNKALKPLWTTQK